MQLDKVSNNEKKKTPDTLFVDYIYYCLNTPNI